jgi:cytochrome c-type biogenesis protein CcmH
MPRAFLACFLVLVFLTANSTAQELNSTQLAQLSRLEHRFMSPCCYGEQLYGHLSPQAVEMKQEIASMVLEGRSDEEIIEYFKGKFGARILVEPEGVQWWVMNVVPVVLLMIGLAFTVWIIRKWYRPPAAPREA